MYIEKSLVDYIDLTSLKLSAPGGGSVLALVSSLGNALSEMAMNFTKDKKVFDELDIDIKNDIYRSMEKIEEYRGQITKLVDLDTTAFNKVLEAYKIPREEEIRAVKIEQGYKEALDVPLNCFRYSFESLKLQEILAKYSDKSLISDSGIGALLSFTAMEGSLYNIKINIKGIKDEKYVNRVMEEVESSMTKAKVIKNIILGLVEEKL